MNTSHHNISTAFECLHEEIEQAVVAVQQNAAQRIQQGEYSAAEAAIAEAKWIREFQKTILGLEEAWLSHWSTRSPSEPNLQPSRNGSSGAGTTPAAFHAQCLKRAQTHLSCVFQKKTRSSYVSGDGGTGLVCKVSKKYNGSLNGYWYGFYEWQREFLESYRAGYLLLGCGDENTCLLIPINALRGWLRSMSTTQTADSFYSHIRIEEKAEKLQLILNDGRRVGLEQYLLP